MLIADDRGENAHDSEDWFWIVGISGYLLMLWGGVAFGSILEGIGRYGYGTARTVDMGLIAVFL